MTPDSELLDRYAKTNAEEAFAELVKRHLNIVYSAALRQVHGDTHLAQDVAQTVFTDLARKAPSLSRRTVLTGWLYTSTHFAAAKAVRGEVRRRAREQEAHTMRESLNEPATEFDWDKLRPVLDKVMHELKDADREAILLRYFENRQFAEIGEKLGLNENTARMRVERALEKLRGILAHRGVMTVTALSTVISANAVQLAPVGLAATLTSTSLALAGTGTTLTLMKIMTMTKLKLAISTIVVAGAAATVVIQHQAQTKLTDENQSLRQQMDQMQVQNELLSNSVAHADASASRPDDQLIELLKLRNEVRLLREQTNALFNGLAKLNKENGQMRNAITAANNQSAAQADFNRQRIDSVNALKQIALAIRVFSLDNNDRFATNYAELSNELGGLTNQLASKGMSLDDFEFVTPGLVNDKAPDKIMLREKNPRKTPEGKWQKAYALADGSVQVINSEDGNFDFWEQDRIVSPPNR